jgi:predicted metal-dependent phosphoesterase TrpH
VKIDLHTHSAFSDGRESVAEVFQCAAQAGLDVVALTDHDTTDGWQIAEVEAAKHRLSFVPGIELTTNHHDISVHLLAYLPSAEYEPLQIAMAEVRAARETRIERYVENLRAHPDYENLTLESVLAEVREEGKSVGRPHIADAMVTLRIFDHRNKAFEGPLDKSADFYVPSAGIPTVEAIKMVRAAGGVPVMAHPMARADKEIVITDRHRMHFLELIHAGLAGFEVNHREVGEVPRAWLMGLVDEFDLVYTGSSDYHGLTGKDNRLGENTTSLEMLKRIEAQATGTFIRWA